MRGFARFIVLLIVGLALVYLGGWWYVQGRLAMVFHAQEQSLRQAGWTITHGATARGRSPAAATYRIADLKFAPPSQGIALPTLTFPLVVLAVHPLTPFTIDFGLPLVWQATPAQGPALTLRFTGITAQERLDPNALFGHGGDPAGASHLAMTGMRVDSAHTNFTLVSLKSLIFDARRVAHAGARATALHDRLALTGLALSPLFVTLGHLPFDGKVASFDAAVDLSGPIPGLPPGGGPIMPAAAWQRFGPVIHQWAKAGGHGKFAFGLGLGPLDAHDTGRFSFDSATQPVGTARLNATGVGEFLGDLANSYPAMVGLVSKLTAGTAPYITKAPSGKQRLTVNFALARGALTANGKPAATVPPVVWPAAPAKP